MIKRDDLKYISLGNNKAEILFDLSVNPQETVNYINDSKYAEQVALFRKRSKEL